MAPMKTRPITPPQSVANCWMAVETEASGSGEAVTRSLSAGDGLRCSRGQSDMDAQAAERGLLEAQLALVQHDLLGDDRQPEARPRAVGAAPRVNGSSRRSRSSARMPGPSSSTRRS